MPKSSDYKFIKRIGAGCFSEVYLVEKIKTKELFVHKRIDLSKSKQDDRNKYLKSEKAILEQLNHKNIVKFYDYFEDNNFAYFEMEYCNGGSLANFLENYKKTYKNPFPPKLIQIFSKQIVEGLAYIHSKGIIHRDLKLSNILLHFKNQNFYDYKNAEIKIIDFGLSSLGISTSIVGSPNYMDPKILEKIDKAGGEEKLKKYDEKADIWSLGAICYEMLTGGNLFKAKDLVELVDKAEKGIYFLPLNLNISKELFSFLNAMLQYEPKNRASAKELLNYPFLNKNTNEFSQFDFSQIAYKIKDGVLIINFINNDTINGLFNPELAQKNNTIEIRLNMENNPKTKFDENLKKELNELLGSYEKARVYFKNCKLIKQEEDAKQKIKIILEMQKNMALGQPIKINNKPKKIVPEYIYGCSTKERNEIFNLLINTYKKKKETQKNLDNKKINNLDYIISNLENAYKDKWVPPPKYINENLNSNSNEKYLIKFDLKRLDNINKDCSLIISLVINSDKILKEKIQVKQEKNINIGWTWKFSENDWNSLFNNNKSSLHLDIEIGWNEKYNKIALDIEKEKFKKPLAFNILQPISKESNKQNIIINFSLNLIINSNEGKAIEMEKKLICQKIYPPFEGGNSIWRSSIF